MPDIVETSLFNQKSRIVGELDYLTPAYVNNNDYYLLNGQFKYDNQNNMEMNLGMIYRHVFDDQYIFSLYNYYDRKATQYNLSIAQWTPGVELLTENYDLRMNLHLAQNKTKIIADPEVSIDNQGTQFFAVYENIQEEHGLSGYDIEAALPLSNILKSLSDIKLFVSKYYFHKTEVATKEGIRVQFEKKILDNINSDEFSNLILSIGGVYKTDYYWSNFQRFKNNGWEGVIGLKWTESIRKHRCSGTKCNKLSQFNRRVMEPMRRNKYIVTSLPENGYMKKENLYLGQQKINNVYFVGHADNPNHEGDGTAQNPFSVEQFNRLRDSGKLILTKEDIVMPMMIDSVVNQKEYDKLMKYCDENALKNQGLTLRTRNNKFFVKSFLPRIDDDEDDDTDDHCIDDKNCTCPYHSKDDKPKEPRNPEDVIIYLDPRFMKSLSTPEINNLEKPNPDCDLKHKADPIDSDALKESQDVRLVTSLLDEGNFDNLEKPNPDCDIVTKEPQREEEMITYIDPRFMNSLMTPASPNLTDPRLECICELKLKKHTR